MDNLWVNDNGDFGFDGQNNLRMVSGDDELLQEISLLFRENKGEYFLTPDDGFPKYEVLGQKYDRDAAIDAAYEVLLRNSRIASVSSLDVTYDRSTRLLTITFAAVKGDGSTISGEVGV